MYKCFNLDRFLDAAFNNFQNQAVRHGNSKNFTGVLCLADTPISIKFRDLLSIAKNSSKNMNLKKWQFFNTDENVSLKAESSGKKSLFIVAGQQIVTKEKLELLAIGTDKDFQNGTSIRQLITSVIETGAIPILPWGFGKWLGKRKKIIEQLLKDNNSLFFGDSSGRFALRWFSFMNKVVRLSKKPVLNGTDPLPFSNQDEKAGQFGFSINEALNYSTPWFDLKKKINDFDNNVTNYGNRDKLFQIITNQFLLRI